jgi:monovalent cation/hydrogen antiporter
MHENELLLLALMVAVAGLSVLALILDMPYPILLVLGGLVLGFVPGMPPIEFPPDLVLVVFLPPLLYWAAFLSSPRDLRADLRAISLSAVGLVLATIAAVAWTAHTLIDGLPWAAAVVLGAIVAPTDPLAATTIARRLGVPRRLLTVIEGESLLNDATALVAYRIAVGVVVDGSFTLWGAGLRFVGAAAVLATVTTGLYLGWRAPELASVSTRLIGTSFWKVLTYLLNAVLFILVGLQLPTILDALAGRPASTLVAPAVLVSAAVVAVRIAWGFTVPYRIRALDRRPTQRLRRVGARERAGEIQDDGYEDRSLAYQRLVRELLEAQRRAIIQLRNQGAISADVMHRVERDLDLEDSRLEI